MCIYLCHACRLKFWATRAPSPPLHKDEASELGQIALFSYEAVLLLPISIATTKDHRFGLGYSCCVFS